MRLSSGIRHHLWRAAMYAMPIPVLAKAKDSAYWQKHWGRNLPTKEFEGYAASTELKRWFAKQMVALKPGSVLELGCNVGANLREIHALDPSIKLYGIELNPHAIEWGQKNVVPAGTSLINGSMADASSLMSEPVDIVFTSAAAMHCDDTIFGAAKMAALSIATKAIVHLEFNAWSPADLHNWRAWRSSFMSDRWIRDYVGEYRDQPHVDRIETIAVPMHVNFMDNIGRVMVSDVTGCVVAHLNPRMQ
ncbi:class I SAM-dependent methyltransferase [Bradyrhizobium sp. ORS 86]|uniref:class I SAM-dependent methyltransferase n=1 Tax=Bradyrhizobium sp. ORS 86 TaxID=1685970 RepID=UPI0038905C7D